MSITFIYLSALASVVSSFHDDPIIMERPVHRVEWEEVMQEYEVSMAPQRNFTVDAELNVTAVKTFSGLATILYDIITKWPEPRLRIPDGTIVPVPKNVHLWKPNIILQNAINDTILRSAMYYSHGLMHLNEKRMAILVQSAKDPLELRIFEDGSAESIYLNVTAKESLGKYINRLSSDWIVP